MKKPTAKLLFSLLFGFCLIFSGCSQIEKKPQAQTKKAVPVKKEEIAAVQNITIDTTDYNKRILAISNGDTTGRWPVKTPYPLDGAILPYHRIIAFYGNLYSKRMGILGQIPKDQMIAQLKDEVAKWQAADSTMIAIPALHYIAVTAQADPGKNNFHNKRMPFQQIDKVLEWAKPINALVFLDIQVGHSTVKVETARLEKYLAMPNVHFGIDPEFSMKDGHIPGTKIGYFNAEDVNDAIDILAEIVRKNKLPPKVLIVHRFTQGMIKGYKKIKTVPEVQVVMDMDGFGDRVLKRSTYKSYIFREPVQFTGFKLFYKNDIAGSNRMFTKEEVLALTPKPVYIQYQ
ncbi:MAG: hypothetical protein V4548_06750 [Bacteroidota bacterium]